MPITTITTVLKAMPLVGYYYCMVLDQVTVLSYTIHIQYIQRGLNSFRTTE